ncbi:MAG: XdhC family protein [Saprospiraceae bacterium]|nr:XdhC family protein [Saprospiraceae bacterium]
MIQIIVQAIANQQNGKRQVLATVVDLDGSSYRKPGVRMLMDEDGNMTGAVSGGCVEKEVLRRAQRVFDSGEALVMTYDGRYRLGCEGVLYILLEPFKVSTDLQEQFFQNITLRRPFEVHCWYRKESDSVGAFGSLIYFGNGSSFSFSTNRIEQDLRGLELFSQDFQPLFKLIILGGEHDSVKLCSMAHLLGWEVEILTSWREPRQLSDFPGATKVIPTSPDMMEFNAIDQETAVVLMSHNFSLDLKYLIKLKDSRPAYLGIIGSIARRDQLHAQLLELNPETSLAFIEQIHSPAGLNIGAVTPAEIALSILSEILSITRKKEFDSLQKQTIGVSSR